MGETEGVAIRDKAREVLRRAGREPQEGGGSRRLGDGGRASTAHLLLRTADAQAPAQACDFGYTGSPEILPRTLQVALWVYMVKNVLFGLPLWR